MNAHYVTHDGSTRSLREWSQHTGLRYSTLCMRLLAGWSVSDALTTSAQPEALTHDGETLSLSDWTTRMGVGPTVIRSRLAIGWTVERALTTPVRPRRKTARPAHVAPGVVNDFLVSSGTGGGSIARDISEIEFSS